MQARASQVGTDCGVHAELAGGGPGGCSRHPEEDSATEGLAEASNSGIMGWYRVFVRKKRQKRVQLAAAWVCLLAVALLYAPLAGAALLANGVNCCAGGVCPIPEHHHHKEQQAAAKEAAPMDCGHEMSGMTSCSMSCCKDPSRPALIPGAFVLPEVSFAPAAGEVLHTVRLASSMEISRFVKPLSPPPRFASPVL
jgi:hypothetical protein